MPHLAKVNLVGVLLAAVAIYFVGFLWYGLFFSEAYMNSIGVYFSESGEAVSWLGPDGVETRSGMAFDGWMAGGFLIPIILAFAFGFYMKKLNVNSIMGAAGFGFVLAMLVGIPMMAYGLVYSPWHSWSGFFIDASHTVVSYVVGCVVLSYFD